MVRDRGSGPCQQLCADPWRILCGDARQRGGPGRRGGGHLQAGQLQQPVDGPGGDVDLLDAEVGHGLLAVHEDPVAQFDGEVGELPAPAPEAHRWVGDHGEQHHGQQTAEDQPHPRGTERHPEADRHHPWQEP